MSNNKYFLILEDDPSAALLISSILDEAGHQNAIAPSVAHAIQLVEERRPFMAFIDIGLEGTLGGIEMGRLLSTKYNVPFIYTTAQTDPVVIAEAKYTFPSCYLVKPLRREGVLAATEMLLLKAVPEDAAMNNTEDLYINTSKGFVRVLYTDILYISADRNYITAYMHDGKEYLMRSTLKDVCGLLPSSLFMQTHRSYVINTAYISQIRYTYVLLGELKIPVGRSYRLLFSKYVGI